MITVIIIIMVKEASKNLIAINSIPEQIYSIQFKIYIHFQMELIC